MQRSSHAGSTAKRAAALLACLAVCACAADGSPRAPDLVSAQFPPGTGIVNNASEPQPVGSLPPGAANFSTAPGATQRNYFTRTFNAI